MVFGCRRLGFLIQCDGNSQPIRVMETALLYYLSGEEVHAGDRVQLSGTFGRIVFVSDGDNNEISPGYEDYSGAERGVVLCDDDGALTFLSDLDGRLEFLDRG